MRLWHQSLIPYLDRQRLLGAHRELCALRGKGWGRKHSVVDYVFTHDPSQLVAYHHLVMNEMKRRGYNPDETWYNPWWRGRAIGEEPGFAKGTVVKYFVDRAEKFSKPIYDEHDEAYLQECLENLKGKGIDLYDAVEGK